MPQPLFAANLVLGSIVVNSGAVPVQYSGSAPILPCGVAQINVRIPDTAASGAYPMNLNLRRSDGTSFSGNVRSTIYVK